MIDTVPKIIHGLSHGNLNDTDKMKFKPVEKITKLCVIECMKKHIPESNATVLYLSMMRSIMEVFIKDPLREILTPTNAVSKLWLVSFKMKFF